MNENEEMGEELKKNIAEEERKEKAKKPSPPKNGGKKRNEKEEKKKTEKEEEIEQYAWLFLALSVLGLFWFFIGSFAGKFWFKIFLSFVIGFVIGRKPKTWLWRIITGIAVFFISMIYAGETTELFRYAILVTGGSALLLFSIEKFSGWNIYPRAMLPVFAVTVVICAGLLLGDLFQDHKTLVDGQKVSVSNLQKEKKTEKQFAEKFSFFKSEIESPEFLIPVIVLEKEEKSIAELSQDWLPVKVKNSLPAEYWRANFVIRRALFLIFLFAVHAVYVPVGSLEAAKDYLQKRQEKTESRKREKGETSRLSYWFIERAWEQFENLIRGKRRKK